LTLLPHRAPDGTFQNPWPDSVPHGFGDVLRWARERRRQPRAPTPPDNSLPTTTPAIAYPRAPTDERRATWIGHSTVLLQLGGLNILTDPMWSERASPVQWAGPRRIMSPAMAIEALPPLDIVLLSHSHYDHLDKGTVKRLARAHPQATWIVPLKLGAYIRGWGVRQTQELDWWENVTVHGLDVTATPSRHFSARRLGDRNKTLWCGFTLAMNGVRAYFAADTAYHPEFGAIGQRGGPFHLVMMPIGAYDPRWFMHIVHVNPEEAVQAYVDVASASPHEPSPLMLAIHWGTFRLTDEPMEEPPKRALAAWRSHGLDEDRLWVARFGETRTW
jgi:N-acyl-phosphatidylethanolamine-hydrolysing phospholipase D